MSYDTTNRTNNATCDFRGLDEYTASMRQQDRRLVTALSTIMVLILTAVLAVGLVISYQLRTPGKVLERLHVSPAEVKAEIATLREEMAGLRNELEMLRSDLDTMR